MILPPDFTWLPNILDVPSCDAHMRALLEETPWEDHTFQLFGRSLPMPRRIAYYGEHPYAYSGVTHAAVPFTPRLHALRTRLEALADQPFNVVLLNLYRDGSDSMGWHSDDDYACGDHPGVASLSFGATRRFRMRSKSTPRTRYGIDLTPGGVLLMRGRSQLDWQHALPKTRRAVGPRINLTFRWMLGS